MAARDQFFHSYRKIRWNPTAGNLKAEVNLRQRAQNSINQQCYRYDDLSFNE